MFGSNISLPGRIATFFAAQSKYNSIKPIRGRMDQNTRPLARRSNDDLTIRQEDTTFVVRLYHTDIVTYSADGLVELKPYASVLTNRVMWSLMGPTVQTYWSDRRHGCPDHITEVGGYYYHTPEYAAIRQGQLVAGSKPFEVPRLDRKLIRQAQIDSGFTQFKLWLETQIRLGTDPRNGDSWRSKAYEWSPNTLMNYLTTYGVDGWAEITRRMSPRCTLETEYSSMRRAIYQYAGCYDTEEVAHFTDYREMMNAVAMMAKQA